MPIFSYFAVVGSVLVALLFVADANAAEKCNSGTIVTSEPIGIPKPWRPDPAKSSRRPRRPRRT